VHYAAPRRLVTVNILITGCSTGIGLATALHLASKGHSVFAGVRNPEGPAPNGTGIRVVRIDVDDDDSVRDGVAEVLAAAGHIDVLVNNAGVGGGGPVEIAPLARARQTFETNYFGAVRMMQAVLPGMRERRAGMIVNVTSVAGRVSMACHTHYAASKFALEALSESMAAEVYPLGIRVAIIEPGVVLTPIFSKSSRSKLDPGPYEAPMRRLGQFFQKQLENPTMPEEVALAIEHAITTKEPKLRYLVGKDAKALVRGRARMTDEQAVAMHAGSDDEYFAAMEKAFETNMFR
jgi:NAD(P)-dependent dehydrogenase (short-subunit alcohol dehydrogenase family)